MNSNLNVVTSTVYVRAEIFIMQVELPVHVHGYVYAINNCTVKKKMPFS